MKGPGPVLYGNLCVPIFILVCRHLMLLFLYFILRFLDGFRFL